MLQGTLILLTIQWAGACICYALARYGRTWSRILAWVLGVLGFLLLLGLGPTQLLQFLALSAIAVVCLSWKRPSVLRFALASIAGSVLAIAATDWYAQTVWGNVAREFPLESLADRLAYETEHPVPLSPDPSGEATSPTSVTAILPAGEALQKLDETYDRGYRYRSRNRSLEIAHASQLEKFINVTESFGVSRMPLPRPAFARRSGGPPIPLPQVKLICTDTEPAAVAAPLLAPPSEWNEHYHSRALANFANLSGWGYVQDRDHVAGFESHGFDEYFSRPDDNRPIEWQMLRIELVSLLKHDVPGVYISEFLPAMDELREAPVRPLDAFEERSLATLLAGGDIEAEVVGQHVRMLGSIRAAEKCLDCHTVEHGALLGAFSYVLLPAAAVEKQVQKRPLRSVPQ
jgi:hypothetical protein